MSSIHIPGYRVLSQLGEGGMSSVYLAEQLSFGRLVALKILTFTRAETEHFGLRFLREARIAAHLSHPNIVQVFDTGEIDSNFFLAMEYLPGGDLKKRIKSGIPLLETLEIIKSIASAIDYAANRGVIHRDIKPANIMFREDGTVCLVDFGIAKDLTSDTEVTQHGTALGTPRYMSPEQALIKELDIRSDLYSLGVVFFELLSGQAPFSGNSAAAVGVQHVSAEVPRLPENTSAFQEVIDVLLAKLPEDRFQTGEELIWALEQLQEQMPEKLSTTILLSHPHAGLEERASSGFRSTRSRRRVTRTRDSLLTPSSARKKNPALVVAASVIVFALVGVLAMPLLLPEVWQRIWNSPPPPLIEAPDVVDPIASQPTAGQNRVGAMDGIAMQTLEKASLALEEGLLESAATLLELVRDMPQLSLSVQERLAALLGEQEQILARNALVEELSREFDLMLESGALFAPDGSNAFTTLEKVREVDSTDARLTSFERRLLAAANAQIEDQISQRNLRRAKEYLGAFEKFAPDAPVSALHAKLKAVQQERMGREAAIGTLKKQIASIAKKSSLTSAERRDLLSLQQELLVMDPKNSTASSAIKRLLREEIAEADLALRAGNLDAAGEASSYLQARYGTYAEVVALVADVRAGQQLRAEAERVLTGAKSTLAEAQRIELGNTSVDYHRQQALGLAAALREADRAASIDGTLHGTDDITDSAFSEFKDRINLFDQRGDRDIAELYLNVLSASAVNDPRTVELRADFEEREKSPKKDKPRTIPRF